MEKTVPHPYLGKFFIGYVVNTPFSTKSQQVIVTLQQKLKRRFGDAVFIPPAATLHITLMDWLAPLVDYGRDKDALYPEIYEEYDQALLASIEKMKPIDVRFDFIGAGPEAVFLKGTDNGQYQTIREDFLRRVKLLPGTKMPPKIIHTSIARFTRETDLEPVKEFVQAQSINFSHRTDFFRLLRTIDTTMENKKLLKVYELK